MLNDAKTPGTDDWWLMRLATKLGNDFPRLHLLRCHRDGSAPLPVDTNPAMRRAYESFLRRSRLNFGELIVTAMTSRLVPTGFRTAAAGDEDGDGQARRIWAGSRMRVQMRDLLMDLGTYGRVATLVDKPTQTGGMPSIARLSPWEYYVERDPWQPWKVTAALRIGWDPVTGADQAWLYRDGTVRTATHGVRTRGVALSPSIPSDGSRWRPPLSWDWAGDGQEIGWATGNPVTEIAGREGLRPEEARILGVCEEGPLGRFEAHIGALDRVNSTIKDRLTIVAMQAFRQRALKGDLPKYYPADHPQAGQPIDYDGIFEAGPAALWQLPADVDIWESNPTDITPIITAAEKDLKNLAASSKTPLYVLAPDAAAGSAEGAALSRETLIFDCEDWKDRTDVGLAETMGRAFEALGDSERADVSQIEVIWKPLDRASLVEQASSAAAMRTAGAPWRLIAEKALQMTPPEIAQSELDRQNDAFLKLTATVNVGGGEAQQ